MKATTITVTYGTKTLKVYTTPAAKAETREALEVTTVTDSTKKFIPGALTEEDEFTLTIADEGEGMPTVADDPKTLTITATLSDGSTTKTATVTYSGAIVTKVVPGNIEASGERKATLDITFRPSGN